MTPQRFLEVFEQVGSIQAVCRKSGVPYRQARNLWLKCIENDWIVKEGAGRKPREKAKKLKPQGQIKATAARTFDAPKKGKVKRYILTCAQNNTKLHKPFWNNLLALKEHYGAGLHIARFLYIKNGLGASGDKATAIKREPEETWWDEAITPFLSDERAEIAPGLVWCGEMNTLPTAVRPLSGLEVYTGRRSGIFPHVKIAMDSIASARGEPTKFNYTTGTVTQRNYIQRKAGLKAEFHHCFHPDTEYLTRQGLRTLKETCGSSVEVWSGAGWETAEIKSFGVQPLQAVSLTQTVQQNCNGTVAWRKQHSNVRPVVRCTPEHEWILQDGTRSRALKVGDKIQGSVAKVEQSPDYYEGVRHGLVFGDGSIAYKSAKTGLYTSQLCFHGDNAAKWLHLFDPPTRWATRGHIKNYHGTVYYKTPTNMKELPAEDASPSYLAGFLQGWVDADGSYLADGSLVLSSVTKYALDWARKVAPYAGWTCVGETINRAGWSTFGSPKKECRHLKFRTHAVTWEVTAIAPLPAQEVMCAVVEPSHSFTLAGGILTGNCYGALLVEVDHEGNWFVRQLHADSNGVIYDLGVCVRAGKVTTGNRVEAITWGDIHVAEMDKTIRELCFNEGAMLDALRPKHQFLHDVLHFRGRSHHELKDPHMMFKRYQQKQDCIAQEVRITGNFITDTLRPWCKTIVVDSNHHHHLGRWLKEQDGRLDPLNAPFWFDMQQRIYAKIMLGEPVNYLVEALKQVGVYPPTVRFLEEDESYVVCPDEHGGVECGQHGDLGPNGSRGSALNFAKMGRRANIGHSHSARIADGVYQSGTCGELAPDWTHGPGSWSHSHIVVYPNGKRAIVTMWNGRWRA